jgi:hypothetical protein
MTIRQTTLAAALALAAIGPADAEGLKPLQGQVIDLGDVSGVAYYTVGNYILDLGKIRCYPIRPLASKMIRGRLARPHTSLT